MDTESSYLTTFQTCFGRYRWLRLPFGLNVSSEIFQKKILEAFQDLPGIVCIADDVVIHGRDKEEHDKHLKAFMARCRELGVKLNAEKMETALDTVTFMGHRISKSGLGIDPEKVSAITSMKEPENVGELRRFNGMINYIAKFVPNLATAMQPLHNLLKKDTEFIWSTAQEAAFKDVKDLVSKAAVLNIYDPEKELVVENDASEYGLGSVLLQDAKPIAYASRALSETEQRYAQIEKEMLAAVYGLEKFHHFTFGREVTVVTDHKPLVAIDAKPLSKAPRRLQNLLMRAKNYRYSLIYKAGKEIPVADTLSRAPVAEASSHEVETVNNVTLHPMKDYRLEQVRGATTTDEVLMKLGDVIMKGWPNDRSNVPSEILPYFPYRDEMTVQDGIIMRGTRIVVPTTMRRELKERLHVGHMGVNSCLRRAREVLYWPGMSAEIRHYIESCGTCMTYTDRQPKESTVITDVPGRSWQKVASDLLSWGGCDYLITTDYHSNFFEIDRLYDTTSNTVINKLKSQFARYGIPHTLVTDNGPQYTSIVFRKFMSSWNIVHEPISPGNSQANGAAEASVKIAKRIMRKTLAAGEDVFLALLNYCNTPTEGTETSPAQRLLGRRTQSMIPVTESALKPGYNDPVRQARLKEERRLQSQKSVPLSRDLKPLEVGDIVRMEPLVAGSRIWPEATVSKNLTSRSVEVTNNKGQIYRRNRRHLRKSVPATHSVPSTTRGVPAHEFSGNKQASDNELPQQNEPEASVASPPPRKESMTTQTLTSSPVVTTRAGRQSRKPIRYDPSR